MSAEWVRSLAPEGGDDDTAPISFAPTIAAATERIGPGAVAWAAATARQQVHLNLARLPPLTPTQHDFELVRLAVEPAILAVLTSLDAGVVVAAPIPDEIRFVLREYVRRQVPLDVMWASILRGHGELAEALGLACRRLVAPAGQAVQLQLVSRLVFEYMGQLSTGAGDVYAEEERLWARSAERTRDTLVRAVLAGERTDAAALEPALRYRIGHRTHTGLLLRQEAIGRSRAGCRSWPTACSMRSARRAR